jgi:hypothetical protein
MTVLRWYVKEPRKFISSDKKKEIEKSNDEDTNGNKSNITVVDHELSTVNPNVPIS